MKAKKKFKNNKPKYSKEYRKMMKKTEQSKDREKRKNGGSVNVVGGSNKMRWHGWRDTDGEEHPVTVMKLEDLSHKQEE